MDLVNEWLETFQGVLTQPTEFFGTEQRRDGFKYPLKFAAVNLVLSGIISAGTTFVGTSAVFSEMLGIGGAALLAGLTLILTPVIGLVGLLISAGFVHLFVHLLGGEEGYAETLAVAEYATALSPVTSVISAIPLLGSVLNLLFGLYGIYINVRGLQNFQNLSAGRALVALILPAVIVTILVLILAIVVAGAIFATSAGTATP